MKHLTILLLLIAIIFSSELISAQDKTDKTQQYIIESRKEVDKLQLKNEELKSEIQQLKIRDARTEGKVESFDSNIDPYNNHLNKILTWLGIVITIMLGLLALISWQFIFKRINSLETEINKLPLDRMRIRQAVYDAHHTLYNIYFTQEKFGGAAQVASWCLEKHIEDNNEDAIQHWFKTLRDRVKVVWCI